MALMRTGTKAVASATDNADIRRAIIDRTAPYSRMESLLKHMREQARSQVAQYPQYDDKYFKQYTQVAVILRNVTTKLGLAFRTGQVVLIDPKRQFDGDNKFACGWSFNNAIGTALRRTHYAVIEADSEGYITTNTRGGAAK